MKYWLTFNEISSAIMFSVLFEGLPKNVVQEGYIKLHHQLAASAKQSNMHMNSIRNFRWDACLQDLYTIL